MIAPVRTIRAIAPVPAIGATASQEREEPQRGAALLAGCVAIDAVAAGILLFGTPLSPLLEGSAAAVLHATAVLLLSGMPYARPSRRWLCAAALLAVPCVGAAVAAAAIFTSGRGTTTAGRRRKARRRPELTVAAMERLRDSLSPYDALDSGDDEQRRAALSTLSRRGDRGAIALLRRAASGRDPDLALSAALVLDEIGERAERQAGQP
jgi:hypothetical protein